MYPVPLISFLLLTSAERGREGKAEGRRKARAREKQWTDGGGVGGPQFYIGLRNGGTECVFMFTKGTHLRVIAVREMSSNACVKKFQGLDFFP